VRLARSDRTPRRVGGVTNGMAPLSHQQSVDILGGMTNASSGCGELLPAICRRSGCWKSASCRLMQHQRIAQRTDGYTPQESAWELWRRLKLSCPQQPRCSQCLPFTHQLPHRGRQRWLRPGPQRRRQRQPLRVLPRSRQRWPLQHHHLDVRQRPRREALVLPRAEFGGSRSHKALAAMFHAQQ